MKEFHTSADIDHLFSRLGVWRLVENRYEPLRFAKYDVRHTAYWRRNRIEFDQLRKTYGEGINLRKGARVFVRDTGDQRGYSLAASDPIDRDGLIGEYIGMVQPARPGRALPGGRYSSDYAWGFPRLWLFGRNMEIDARSAGGLLRFANHSQRPRASVDHLEIDGHWRVFFRALRDIAAGEEITVDYGESYWAGGHRILVLDTVEEEKTVVRNRK